MRRRPARRAVLVGVAWAIAALGAAIMTTLAVTMSEIEVSGPWLATFTALGGVVVAFASFGAIVALRRPRNLVGIVLMPQSNCGSSSRQ